MKTLFLIISAILLSNLQLSGAIPLQQEKIVYAIDVGSNQPLKTEDGILYSEDKYFDEHSRVADYKYDPKYNQIPIRFTNDPLLYLTERHGDKDWGYKLPFAKQEDGPYVLIVQFCELWFDKPDQRKTNIAIGNTIVSKGVDMIKESGPFTAHDVYVQFEIKQGKVYFEDKLIEGGLNSKKELVITFQKTKYDLPKVDGMIVLKGGIYESNYREYVGQKQAFLEKMQDEERNKLQEKAKREKARKILQEEFDSSLDTGHNIGFIESIIKLLQQPIGISIIVCLALFFFLIGITADNKRERPDYEQYYTVEEVYQKKVE